METHLSITDLILSWKRDFSFHTCFPPSFFAFIKAFCRAKKRNLHYHHAWFGTFKLGLLMCIICAHWIFCLLPFLFSHSLPWLSNVLSGFSFVADSLTGYELINLNMWPVLYNLDQNCISGMFTVERELGDRRLLNLTSLWWAE